MVHQPPEARPDRSQHRLRGSPGPRATEGSWAGWSVCLTADKYAMFGFFLVSRRLCSVVRFAGAACRLRQ